jgi:hypothetical protein
LDELDGASYSGSGTIVRQALTLAALTGVDIRITNIRAKRPHPGLRPQHTWVVEAIRELVGGKAYGNDVGSSTLVFKPGREAVPHPLRLGHRLGGLDGAADGNQCRLVHRRPADSGMNRLPVGVYKNRGGLTVAAVRHCPIGVTTASWGCPPRLSEVIDA